MISKRVDNAAKFNVEEPTPIPLLQNMSKLGLRTIYDKNITSNLMINKYEIPQKIMNKRARTGPKEFIIIAKTKENKKLIIMKPILSRNPRQNLKSGKAIKVVWLF